MKTRFTCVAWLLLLMLTACSHKPQQSAAKPYAPPIDPNAPKPTTTAAEVPPAVATVPTQPASAQIKPPDQPLKPKTHHKKPVKETEQASNAAPAPEVSAIGTLSPADPPDEQLQTKSSIDTTERTLNGITRKLDDQEMKTAAQIREFLKQAKTALASGDVDGAHTLAVKAGVLLAEINP
ncbi:MAG TPA: hypothetical protein VKR52_00265 [Terracidiphilus sp.]|nr:hypothetical protein [Terracidiphilus sp.]